MPPVGFLDDFLCDFLVGGADAAGFSGDLAGTAEAPDFSGGVCSTGLTGCSGSTDFVRLAGAVAGAGAAKGFSGTIEDAASGGVFDAVEAATG